MHPHVEVSDVARDVLNFAVGHQVDIWVASHGRHFRSENSSRTVERGECLVKLSHMPANARLPLD